MSASSPRVCAIVIAPVLALSGLLLSTSPAQAISASVVISEVYGGGGNSGATLTHDFVELYNPTDAAVDVSGWVVQYYAKSGTAGGKATLTGTVAPHRTYLVQMGKGTGGTTPLPAPEATGTAAMSGTDGRIDLLTGPLAGAPVVDRIGYGEQTLAEGSPALALSNTTSAARNVPCSDTDDNATDFRATDPTPENGTVEVPACADLPAVDEPETIAQIQGSSHISPFAGKSVNGVRGIVTAVGRSGYWIQSTSPDDDPASSEGLFVFTRAAVRVKVGDLVSIDGSITDFRPGGSRGNDNLTTTELTGPKVTVTSTGNALPSAVVLGVDRTAPQQVIENGNPLNVESPAALFRPATDAIDFYESLEGMRVAVRDAKVVGATKSFGELTVIPGKHVKAVNTRRGGVLYSGYDHPNAMRVQLDDALLPAGAMPLANVGDSIAGDTVGVLDYSFGNPKLEVTATPTLTPGGLQREVTRPQSGNQLAMATFNVENLTPGDTQTKFDRLASQVVRNLASPDILALQEIQDNSGATSDGTVDSTRTTDKLIAAIVSAGGPAYSARWVNPENLADGGQPGGNIRQVFLYRTDRGVGFAAAPAGDATTAESLTVVDGKPHLALNPGRITPSSAAWERSRKPLVAEFTFAGETIFAIANHFASKGGDDPLFGRWQQPVRSSETQRHLQAQEVRSFVDQVLAADQSANVVVLGDINDFEFSRTVDIMVGAGATALVDLPRTLPVKERYSYVFEGNSQILDQILVSQALTVAGHSGKEPAFEYDIVHTNSEFHDQDSDHDPQVVRLAIGVGKG